MLSIFRTNQSLSNIFVLLYLIVLRLSTFIHPTLYVPKNQGVLSNWVFDWIHPSTLMAHFFSLVLVFVQAVMINGLIQRFRITSTGTLLPGVFYCLVTSFSPEFLTLSPLLLGNTFLILGVWRLFEVYKNPQCADTIFDVGLWVGVASLFQFSYAILIVWIVVGLAVLRGLNFKELFMAFLGFLVPSFLMGVYLFWTNQLPSFYQTHIGPQLGFMHLLGTLQSIDYIKVSIFGSLILLTIIMSGSFFSKRNISAQKFIEILFWLMIFAGLSLVFQSNLQIGSLLIFSVPLGILLSLSFLNMGSAAAEALHTLLFVGALLLQYEFMLI